jgi:hypothetical protein
VNVLLYIINACLAEDGRDVMVNDYMKIKKMGRGDAISNSILTKA